MIEDINKKINVVKNQVAEKKVYTYIKFIDGLHL